MDMQKIDKYVEMRQQKDAINRQLKDLNAKIEEVEVELIEELENDGIQTVKTQDGITVTTYIQSFARAVDKEALVNWMLDEDFDSMLTVNARTLTAFYNDRLKNNESLPPGVEQYTKSKISLRR